jgi:predicted nucleic acid-binding protein
MTLYDSSFLIDYLDGDQEVVTYATEHAAEQAKTTQLALYEVYLGELYTDGDPDFDALDDALEWVQPVAREGPRFGRRAAELMARLHDAGSSLAYRDGYIAASAWATDDTLVTRDSGFDTPALRDEIDVVVL